MSKEEEEKIISDFEPESPSDLEEKAQKNIKAFSDLLDSLSTLHEKKKILWREIYENAILDRRNAYIMFGDLYQKVHNSSAEHAIHGATLAKYLERMNKSNEQLIKLAEILDEAVDTDENETLDEDSFYDMMDGKQAKK